MGHGKGKADIGVVGAGEDHHPVGAFDGGGGQDGGVLGVALDEH